MPFFWQSQCHCHRWLACPPPLRAFSRITRLLKLKAHFFFSLMLGVMGKAGSEGWRRWDSVPADCNCETGLWDVDGEVENLSAEVVNLFLASSFSGKRNRETPWVLFLSPGVDPKDMTQNGTNRCHECPLWLWIFTSNSFQGIWGWVVGKAINSFYF